MRLAGYKKLAMGLEPNILTDYIDRLSADPIFSSFSLAL